MPERDSGTWHYGLMAQWWAEFNVAEPAEIAFYRAAIKRFGEPVLDLGCGTGRILLPLLEEGFDVDGVDVSGDMIARARDKAAQVGMSPRLLVQPMHGLDTDRTYRTVIMCGSFGIGGSRDHDREALHRVFRHIAPYGALLITDHELLCGNSSESAWALWLPGHRAGLPRDWPARGDRRRLSDGSDLELATRLVDVDPLAQRRTLEMRIRLWRGADLVGEETRRLSENCYFVPEMLLMLRDAGFDTVDVSANYSDRPAEPDDGTVTFTARRL